MARARLNSGRARQRADDLDACKQRRMRELDARSRPCQPATDRCRRSARHPAKGFSTDLTASPQTPLSPSTRQRPTVAPSEAVKRSNDPGRIPDEQPHNNPGFDILSLDPVTGVRYFIEVKGHFHQRPRSGSSPAGPPGHPEPGAFPPRVASVPTDPLAEPVVFTSSIRSTATGCTSHRPMCRSMSPNSLPAPWSPNDESLHPEAHRGSLCPWQPSTPSLAEAEDDGCRARARKTFTGGGPDDRSPQPEPSFGPLSSTTLRVT